MLKIYERNNIPADRIIEDFPWNNYFESQKVTKYFDDSDIEIVEDIEQTSLLNNSTIQGKFSDMPIGVGELSEGCKTVLCINHAIKTGMVNKYVFNITSCGGNAVDYLVKILAKNTDIFVIIEHTDLGYFENCSVEVNGKIYTDWLSVSKALMMGGEIG